MKKILFLSLLLLTTLCLHAAVTPPIYSFNLDYSNEKTTSHKLTIKRITELALQHNDEYNKIKSDRDAASDKIDKALFSMFPEIRASAAMNNVDKDRPDYAEKAAAEKNPNAKLRFSQPLFSDALDAARDTAESKTNTQRFVAETVRLDIIMKAAGAYYNVLHWRTLLDLDLNGLDRLTVLKNSKNYKLMTKIQRKMLTQAISEQNKAVKEATANIGYANEEITYLTGLIPAADCVYENYDTMLMAEYTDKLGKLLTSAFPDSVFEQVAQMFTDKSLTDSSELQALDELIKLNKREIATEERRYTTPNVSLNGEYTQFLDKTPDADTYTANANNNQWSLNLRLTIPVFDGDNNKPQLYAKNIELMQYMHSRAKVRELVKERMKKTVSDVRAAGRAVAVAKTELDAADVTKLSDTATIRRLNNAEAEYEQAKYSFAVSMLNLQRAYGKFLFLDGDSSDQRFIDSVSEFMRK